MVFLWALCLESVIENYLNRLTLIKWNKKYKHLRRANYFLIKLSHFARVRDRGRGIFLDAKTGNQR